MIKPMVQEIRACGSSGMGKQAGDSFVEAVEFELGLESPLGFEMKGFSSEREGR